MRKLIESALVSLDGVIEAPERWANFDDEDAALSMEQLGPDPSGAIARLKNQPGKDLIKYGTSRFDDTLVRDRLVASGLRLRLTDEKRLENGSVILTYVPT
jgi:hypothetical protein